MGFGEDVDQWCKGTLKHADKVHQTIAFLLFSEIVRRTPVDTGRARASWGIASSLPSMSGASFKIVGAKIGRGRSGQSIFIFNPLPYIIPLEHGHSKQAAPGYMVQGSITKIRNMTVRA